MYARECTMPCGLGMYQVTILLETFIEIAVYEDSTSCYLDDRFYDQASFLRSEKRATKRPNRRLDLSKITEG